MAMTGWVYVVRPEEPIVDDELYVFDTEEAARAFIKARGSGILEEEPVLDLEFVDDVVKALAAVRS